MCLGSWDLIRNIWWGEVSSEKQAHYYYGRKILGERGWTFTAAVIDGRRGLSTVFKDIPVQVCQFHQIKIVTKYLTRRPQTEAGKELRSLTLRLTKTNEKTFTVQLLLGKRSGIISIPRGHTLLVLIVTTTPIRMFVVLICL